MPDDLYASLGPGARAQLVAEASVPLRGAVRLLTDGFLAVPCAREVMVLDRALRVVSRFPVPEELACRYREPDGDIRIDVSPDRRWVVLAGTECMMVVDSTGRVAWRTTYPTFGDAGGDAVPACGVFSSDGSELWAFIPVLGPYADENWVDDAERWVVRTSDWQITGRAESRYRGITDIITSPDGSRLGFAYFDGHAADGIWTAWHDNVESAPVRGRWFPLDVSPDGRHWLGGTWHDIVVGDFTGSEIRLNEDGRWDHWEFTPGACFLDPKQVLVVGRHDGEKNRHLLFRTDTLEPLGYIAYPAQFPDEQDSGFVRGHGDGTWLTMHIPGYERPDEGRLRRWTTC
ncbi:hypothetical protein ACWY4P_38580 [Streptomyces sp. LZ34]